MQVRGHAQSEGHDEHCNRDDNLNVRSLSLVLVRPDGAHWVSAPPVDEPRIVAQSFSSNALRRNVRQKAFTNFRHRFSLLLAGRVPAHRKPLF
ncbi:MAG TPA: hypothetical protein VNK52_05865 [Hyphomicrobiaceae bacterium]|nr:hypothetical protein [Hyphomicrobiaceae bacterium]